MAELRLAGLSKRFDSGAAAVQGVALTVANGEFMVLVGPSGCGKSTTLRMVAGLEDPSDGSIFIGGQDVTDLPPADRGVAMVFQSYALYPHMTVQQNMSFGLRMARLLAQEIEARVANAARILQLEALLQRLPRELSGGQRQRVAIGRAIVREPRIFLFDEPLSNLDAALRTQMRAELAQLHQRLGATIVYVTHDQVEAMTLGNRIALFNAGRIEQVGTPLALYEQPANRFVAGFLGSPRMNFLPVAAAAPLRPAVPPRAHQLGVRPEHLHWRTDAIDNSLPADLERCEHLGDMVLLHCRAAGVPDAIVLKQSPVPAVLPSPGERLYLFADPARVLCFDEQGVTLDLVVDR